MPEPNSDRLQQHPLVDALLPDPSQTPPNSTRIVGYLGRSTASGIWRLYLSPNLDRYVEIPEADILHTQEFPGNEGTAVWVRSDLRLQYVAVQSSQVQADYLSGPVAATAVGAPSGGSGMGLHPFLCLVHTRPLPVTSAPPCTPTAGRICTPGGGPPPWGWTNDPAICQQITVDVC